MQILHIDTGREMRGGQHQVLLLLKGLRARGHESTLLARSHAPLWQAARAAGYEVEAATPQAVFLRSRRTDIAHAHDARAHTLAALASQSKFVVSRRVAFPVKRTPASRWKYRRSAGYLAISEYVAHELESAGVPKSKIHVVYDGVEPQDPVENWSGRNPLVALETDDPGKLGALVSEAAAMAGAKVVFSRDLPRDLRRCSAFIYLSSSEGLGSAAILAMSMGVPVIASQIGGLSEVFVHGVSGLYVANEPGKIAALIRELLGHPALAHRLRIGGMARVAERFSAEHMLSATIRSYERVFG